MPALTPSQTIGPFLAIQVPYEGEERMVPENDPDAIHLRGTVFDGEGEIVDDALIEIWQANRSGRYAHPEDRREELPVEEGFSGFGRCATDSEGRFEFITVKPGPVPGPGGRPQAPHIDVSVFARGPAEAAGDADLLPRRGRGQRGGSRPLLDRGRGRARDARGDPRGRRSALRHPPPG